MRLHIFFSRLLPSCAVFIFLMLFAFSRNASGQFCTPVQWSVRVPPSHVQFTGTLFSPDAIPNNTRGFYTLIILMDGEKKWAFVITKARNLTKAETELSMLKDIFPPQLRVEGEEKILEALRKDEIAGKPIRMEGLLYKSTRRLKIIKVEMVPAEKTSPEAP